MPKVKKSPFYFDERYYYTDIGPSGNVSGPHLVGSYRKLGDNQVELGDNIVGWRQRIASGLNATTSLVGTEWRKTCTPSSLEYGIAPISQAGGNPTQRYTLKGNMLAYFLGSVSSDLSVAQSYLQKADDLAVKSFYSKLAQTQASFKGAVFTGELKESLQMIRNPARSLRKGVSDYLDHLKKNGPRKAKRDRPKFVRDSWLEYSFGWRPLVKDIEDAATAFYTSGLTKPIFKMVSSRGSEGSQPKQSPLASYSAGIGGLYLQFHTETTSRAMVRYYGIYRSSGDGPSRFSYYGFNLYEFVPTLWELIPYSFLVDYFTNIGDILTAWSYRNIGCDWAAKGVYIFNRSEINDAKIILLPGSSYKLVRLWGVPGSSSAEYASRVRSPSVSIPLPSFRLQVPDMGTKWINIAVLSTQLSSTRRSLAP